MKRLLFLLIFLLPLLLHGGTSTIRIVTEGWGTISNPQGEVLNTKGCMFWNGSKWVSNETAAHMYFTYLETGQRIKTPVNIDISARTSTSSVFDTLGYHFERQNYTYSDLAKQGGSYRYEAVQYRIEPSAGRKVVLQSRGTGNGKEKGYFNIYIEDTLNYITALRNDPQWFTYKGMSMDSALQQSSATQYLTGNFPSTNGYYFLDVNGGADMGGLSYIFHTDTLTTSPKTDVLGSSYPVDFGLRCFAPSGGNIIEFRFNPKLVSETYLAPATLAVNAIALNMGYASGSTVTFNITSNADWTINTGQSWLSANPASGTGNKTITLTAQANALPSNRIATVTVSATGTTPQTIQVTQSINTALQAADTEQLLVFPNPFTDGIYVRGIKSRALLSFSDLTGRLLFNREIQEDITIRTSSLSAGMYFLKIVTGDGPTDYKLIKK